MNLNMKKNSFKLDRRMRTEDNGQLDERRPERLPAGHTTPKRTKPPQGHSQEPQEYRTSPILLTQDTNNEVAWDWQSPRTKPKPKQKPEASSTPKHTRLVHKKRNSNSPLVYKPFKKRIIKHDNIASMDKWKSDFMALDAQLETGSTSHENSAENIKSNDISDEIMFDDDFEAEDNNEVISIPDSPADTPNGTPPVVTSTTDVHVVDSKEKESLEDMFNDSLNDESMLRCSQEIEAKLNIGPVKSTPPTEIKELRKYGLTPSIPKNPYKPSVSTTSPSISKFKKYKSEPIAKGPLVNHITSTKEFKSSEIIDLEDFDIPDDSFDEIVKAACAQAAKYDNNTASPSRLFPTKNNNSSTSNLKADTNKGQVVSNYQKTPYYKPKLPIKATPVPSQRSNISQNGTLSSNMSSLSTQMASGNDRKFFKSRNRSDSSFDSTNRLSSMASCTGVGLGARGGKTNSSSVSTKMMDLRRTQSSVDQKTYVMTKENSTNCINHFNRLKVSDGGSLSGSTTSVSRSQTLCTPEEIERKRMEAKLKLEAKRKMQNYRKPVKR